jgi:hypothetical protein
MFQTSTHLWDAEVATQDFKLQRSDKVYKMSAIRIKDDKRKSNEKPTKWHLKDGYYYKFVITNNACATPDEVFKRYHERGAIEKNFDSLKNDFGWRILPFSKLNENLVYMIITAFASNVYHGLLEFFSKKLDIPSTIRLIRFRKIFINVIYSCFNGMDTYHGKNIVFAKIV